MPDRSCRVARAAAAALTLLLLAGCGADAAHDHSGPVSGVSVHDDDGMNGVVLDDAYEVPSQELTATDGSPAALTDTAGHDLTLVFFGYTHCPDVCQVVMADLASAFARLDDSERDRVGMTFVTTDPARDDPATLRSYLDRFDPSFEGLTGPLPRIVRVGEAMGVPIQKGDRLPSGGYEVSHGTQVIGELPDGTAPLVWTEGTAPEKITEDIRTVLHHDGIPTGDHE